MRSKTLTSPWDPASPTALLEVEITQKNGSPGWQARLKSRTAIIHGSTFAAVAETSTPVVLTATDFKKAELEGQNLLAVARDVMRETLALPPPELPPTPEWVLDLQRSASESPTVVPQFILDLQRAPEPADPIELLLDSMESPAAPPTTQSILDSIR
jgi:hypothetical protein